MIRSVLTASLLLTFSLAWSQNDVLLFKKRKKVVSRFWKNSIIAFQLKDGEWQKGEITKIKGDSFFVRPVVVHYYLMGTDTIHYSAIGYSIHDIYAMPKKGYLIDYIDGRFQISKHGGHVHFYWIKSGYLLRLGAAVYAALHIINGIIYNDLALATSALPLGIAAIVFAAGVIMKKTYKLTLRTGNKYHVEVLNYD